MIEADIDVDAAVKFAIGICDKDKTGCLTWDEVEQCLEDYGQDLPNLGYSLPTYEEFENMAGEDGCLTFEEWIEWKLINDNVPMFQ